MVTDHVQKAMVGSRDSAEVNFRVMKADVAQLTAGTVCAPLWQ